MFSAQVLQMLQVIKCIGYACCIHHTISVSVVWFVFFQWFWASIQVEARTDESFYIYEEVCFHEFCYSVSYENNALYKVLKMCRAVLYRRMPMRDSHRMFLQGFMSHGILMARDVRKLYKTSCSRFKGNHSPVNNFVLCA